MSYLFSFPKFHFGFGRADHINGSDGSDVIFGFRGDDFISSLGGNDYIFSDGGSDRIDAGDGNDTVLAGDGNDEIRGDAGSDLLSGGRGFDTAVYSGSITDYTLPAITRWSDNLFTVTDTNGEKDILSEIEAVRFEASNFTLYLDGRNNAALAVDDSASVDEDGALTIDAAALAANDHEFDGDQLTVMAVSETSANGASVSLANGVVSYDQGDIFQHLNDGETATDTFTYTVDDGRGGRDTATVTVTIAGVNDAGIITGDVVGSVIEASDAEPGVPTATGALAVSDVDNDDTFRAVSNQASANSYGSYTINEDGTWTYTLDNDNAAVNGLGDGESLTDSFTAVSEDGTEQEITIAINGTDDEVTPVATPRINEIHYDNVGTDAGEFVEIRVAAGADVSGLMVELYNGSSSVLATYDSESVSAFAMTTDGTYDYYVWNLPANGIQNGSPDGIALSQDGSLIEFLSYEGTFTASNGTAAGTTSTDIGVEETGSETAGLSLQRVGDGPADWTGPEDDTPGASNGGDVPIATPRINEIHYDNAGTDTGEFVEIRIAAGADISGLLVELYNGNGGTTYGSADVSSLTMTSDGEYDYYVWDLPSNGVQNGAPDGVALSQNGNLIEFLSYEGTFTASNGTAAGTTSTDIGVAETGSETAGLSLQRVGDGPTDWVGPEDQTRGTDNEGDTGGGDPTAYRISEIQGTGAASLLVGEYVLVSAIVTYTVGDGFYLQEEDSDADDNGATSEGIFVFTGGAPSVSAGDKVEVVGTVAEYFDFTEITDVTDIVTLSSGNAQPTSASIALSPDFEANLEQYEAMAITLTSGTDDPLTVIENFDLDRFGEVTVSAGPQVQPTQIYDPNTQLAEIQALQEANANNRLTIDDGSSAQNPDEFRYIPASAGDNGNGYLDAGDDFGANGPTLRLGAEMVGPVEGVLTYSFGEYKMLVDGMLDIDEATNARPQEPEDVGGRLTVSSFNLLNYFTTLNDGSGAGSGPNNLEPRGATTAGDLERQTDKIVEAMLKIDASVLGLQELENNGFDDASAIATLVDALNAAAEPGVSYAYVNPTEPGSDGFIGTDAITTGLIYKANEVSLVATDILVFDDGGQQQNRPAIAATFMEIATGEQFTSVVNHLKSKGGTGTGADADQGDGQGAFNATRTAAAQQLMEWLDPSNTDSYFAQNDITDTDVLLIGDLNSYAQEDPVDVIRDAGYVDLIDSFIGQNDAFSYIFDGQQGTLDQGLATASLAGQVSGVTEWHINAQEPDLLSYSSEFNNPSFYNDDFFATSDHDPLIIGLNLGDNLLAA
jgi:VCBS repeat-containing protein